MAANSATVAAWTLVSRVTGLLRVVVIGAVLGPTFLANTFLATNTVPSLIFAAVAGPVLGLVLVPSVVARDARRALRPCRLHVRRMSSLLITAAAAAAGLLMLAAPALAWVLTLGVPAAERGRAWLVALVLLAAGRAAGGAVHGGRRGRVRPAGPAAVRAGGRCVGAGERRA